MTQIEGFQGLPPAEPHEMIGLWTGRGILSGHPLNGVFENLGWFGKRLSAQMRADALLFRGGEKRLVAIDPVWIPLRPALRFHSRAASNLFSICYPG